MFQFIGGVVIGIAIGVLAAIFWPAKWSRIVKEAGEEVKR